MAVQIQFIELDFESELRQLPRFHRLQRFPSACENYWRTPSLFDADYTRISSAQPAAWKAQKPLVGT